MHLVFDLTVVQLRSRPPGAGPEIWCLEAVERENMSHFLTFPAEMINGSRGRQMDGGLRGVIMEQEEKRGKAPKGWT